MKKILFGALVVLLAAAGGVYLSWDMILQRVVKASLLNIATRFQTAMLDDGAVHVWFCGTGSPQVERDRAQSCTAILAGGSFLIFDAGSGSGLKADLGNLPLGNLDAVFFTHLHSDHIVDLPVFMNHSWRYGRQKPLTVIGPAGTSTVVDGFNRALGPDVSYRSQNEVPASPGAAAPVQNSAVRTPMAERTLKAYVEAAFAIGYDASVEGTERTLVYETPAGLKVYAFLVEHEPVKPAFGYRIEYKGKVVVISGDTRKTENIARHATGADYLIHEAYNKDIVNRIVSFQSEVPDTPFTRQVFRIARLTQHYHTTPVEAAELAEQAGVKMLVFSHVIPPLGSGPQQMILRNLFLKGVDSAFKGKVIIAEDGLHLTLPTDGK
ncbi:MAG: MBL fold metallo-hydrolase [Beijerinckiaceae bacterium]